MAIKVLFSENQRDVTVGGLYQWDFGQTLEIECAELGSEIMEVHFACSGMQEAAVRSCIFSNGVGTVTIPDQCLEQASTIMAWVYSISDTQGHTVKTITLPVIARTRPSASREVPAEYVDKYAEALTAVNEAINNLENGTIIVANATHALNADNASTATNAASASYATSAGSITNATSLLGSCEITEGSGIAPDNLVSNRMYFVIFIKNNAAHSGAFCKSSSAEYHTCTLGIYNMALVTGGGGRVITLTSSEEESANVNGTLEFYRFGGVSE